MNSFHSRFRESSKLNVKTETEFAVNGGGTKRMKGQGTWAAFRRQEQSGGGDSVGNWYELVGSQKVLPGDHACLPSCGTPPSPSTLS